MARNVIVEGPDGAGKTTLIRRITERYPVIVHPRACTSGGGPVDDVAGWVDKHYRCFNGYYKTTPGQLFDRHPIFSEPIYGHVLRGDVPDKFKDRAWVHDVLQCMAEDAFVVWCLPPIKIVADNVFKSRPQMPGVTANIGAIWSAYKLYSLVYPGPAVIYDYSNPLVSTNRIEEIIADELEVQL